MKLNKLIILICLGVILVSCSKSDWIVTFFKSADRYNDFYTGYLLYPKLGDTLNGGEILVKFALRNDSLIDYKNEIYYQKTVINEIIFSTDKYFDSRIKTFNVNLTPKAYNVDDTIIFKIAVDSVFPANKYFMKIYSYYHQGNNTPDDYETESNSGNIFFYYE